MAAIVRSACILLCVAASCLLADTHADVVDVFASMAAALTDANASGFMKPMDKDAQDYDTLRKNVAALITSTEISSSVEVVKDDGDDAKRTVDLDWYLQIRSLLQDGPVTNRRQIIRCELQREGKRWKVVSLKPIDFFAPAKLDK